MCGIAGLIVAPDAPPPDPALLEALTRAIAHRGPDGSGHTLVGRVALVHNRLSIIDLVTGDQPLFAGSAALVANGEVYNYRELRQGLPNDRFASNSDCEPPLHLWLRDGADYAKHLRGMYAIAIHERAARTVTLTRDPFGIKPLYVAQTDTCLAFASEAQALLNAGIVPRGVRPAARDELLQLQFTTGAETIFPGIRRVLPGETLVCADGRVLERRHIAALPEGGPETITEEAALARLDRALEESVDLHQRSDVPYGMFLSGGIDSATILTMMARLNSQPVLAFTAGFAHPGAADEREQAATVAKSLGAHHETIEVTEAMVWQHLPEIVACIDDPAADYAIIPTWFLAQRARKDVKVVLSGEGGDEIFGGYGRYRSAMRPWWLGGRVMRARGNFDRVPVLRNYPAAWRDGMEAAEAQASQPGRSRLMAAQAVDMTDWLPNDLLLKMDRCLMAHAVEGRTPFLDPGVAAAAFRLPDALKVHKGMGKWLLRRWLEKHCPAARPFAPKQGFTVPIGQWIGKVGGRLGPLVAAQPGVAEIADPAKVAALFRAANGRRHGFAAWVLLFYALWHRTHVQGLAPAGDVFETLAQC
ncbi:asparagine synthase (glutamine-hydrolyzing) [Limobrevibacterium gyesilva]|uniref:asparagine synthase (glutamine-hydrolyzing) n=1 Tax=Limobrevibacterium gyesilva TaxID=2991712 RepID=A0AA41YQJ6_9PROT|nr:asparagine synthase (glutamine-hydrolyzing) [Limobrevibacterium gyesilva]MCW3477030.1 asparagine synthase (glutamine-hydrolyzing) [Limobrevibacterium gyesilva]